MLRANQINGSVKIFFRHELQTNVHGVRPEKWIPEATIVGGRLCRLHLTAIVS
jgi:hypothetical protein